MEDFNPLLLPDLDSAEVIELKDMRFQRFAHIEYLRKADKSLLRVCRPWGDFPFFYIPIDSLEREYARDLDVIKKSQVTKLSMDLFKSENADDDRDNIWTNENCFSNVKQNEE